MRTALLGAIFGLLLTVWSAPVFAQQATTKAEIKRQVPYSAIRRSMPGLTLQEYNRAVRDLARAQTRDKMNLTTGEYIMGLGGGDKMNLTTGEYIMGLGGGDKMNLTTGDYIMNLGGGDMLNLGSGDYLMNLGGGDYMNLGTGEYIIGF